MLLDLVLQGLLVLLLEFVPNLLFALFLLLFLGFQLFYLLVEELVVPVHDALGLGQSLSVEVFALLYLLVNELLLAGLAELLGGFQLLAVLLDLLIL